MGQWGQCLGRGASSVETNPIRPLSLEEGTKFLFTIWCVRGLTTLSWDWGTEERSVPLP